MEHPGCYLRGYGACSEKLSREHHTPGSILKLLGERIRTRGYPWAPPEGAIVGADDLASKILCERHNNGLTSLDSAGLRLFSAARVFSREGGRLEVNLSGHEIERYILKCAAAYIYSGNSTSRGTKLRDEQLNREVVGQAVVNSAWPPGTGLFVASLPDDPSMWHGTEFAPLVATRADGEEEVFGARFTFAGLPLVSTWGLQDGTTILLPGFAQYRPSQIRLDDGDSSLTVNLQWGLGSGSTGVAELDRIERRVDQ